MEPFNNSKSPEPENVQGGNHRNILIPPVDLNIPITNPELKAAIANLLVTPSSDFQEALVRQLNQAFFLVIFDADHVTLEPELPFGQAHFKPGSDIRIMTCRDAQERQLLPAFTDWDEVDTFVHHQETSILVMPSQQFWEFVMRGTFEGAVINPAGKALPLSRTQVEGLLSSAAEGDAGESLGKAAPPSAAAASPGTSVRIRTYRRMITLFPLLAACRFYRDSDYGLSLVFGIVTLASIALEVMFTRHDLRKTISKNDL